MELFTIKLASKLSGVSELTIRAWETRYGLVTPTRTDSNRRVYSEEQVLRLKAVHQLIGLGHRVSMLAKLSDEELDKLMQAPDSVGGSPVNEELIAQCMQKISRYDDRGLFELLNTASVMYSRPRIISEILLPLLEQIGQAWHEGNLRVAHEHLASAVIRKYLSHISEGYNIPGNAPRIIITTPEGQYHEAGAMISTVLAMDAGWRATYLGPSLAPEEIAAVVLETGARCVLLSLVYPGDNPILVLHFRKLRSLLGADFPILVHGASVGGYLNILQEISAMITQSPRHFLETLSSIRQEGRSEVFRETME